MNHNLAIVFIVLGVSQAARAEPPETEAAPSATQTESVAKAAASPSTINVSAFRASGPPPINLFPPKILAAVAESPLRSGRVPSRPGSERSSALDFDTGDGWKGQTAMIGGMVGGFAVLSALCKGGACSALLR